MAEDKPKDDSAPIKFLKPVFETEGDKGPNPFAVLFFILILVGLISVVISPQGLSTSYSLAGYNATIMQILGTLVVIYIIIMFLGVIETPAKGAVKVAEDIIRSSDSAASATTPAGTSEQRDAKARVKAFAAKFEKKEVKLQREIVVYADKQELTEGETTSIYAIPFENNTRVDGVEFGFEIVGGGRFPESKQKTKKITSAKTEESVAIVSFEMGGSKETAVKVMAAGYPSKQLILTSKEAAAAAAGQGTVGADSLKAIARSQIEDAVRRLDDLSLALSNTVRNVTGRVEDEARKKKTTSPEDEE
ncbi:MAG: hypothetical protein ABH829_00665 [archaeon]